MRRLHVTLLAILVVCVAGCSALKADTTAVSSSAATPQTRVGVLAAVHDPGQVTGTVPASCHAGAGPTPDPTCTPGAIDPAVTQQNISTTICRSNYTAKIRPSTGQTDKVKAEMYKAYGIKSGTTSELDHLVSLELGGSNDVKNLWPEVGSLPNPKDKVENDLHRAVCSGKVTLAAAQRAIATDWLTAEHSLGLS
ncbi:hypothetical protein KDK95_32415 [Actinospica sp. MGRD01-02]|uniref:HNH endonuclease n=1 Tax=Actinospica acidithermotolerans TaxID=2828514 RepID=A0A941EL25_9ACTN|nr:hypothetical protein [Actinospica acidithermotolerans]MBR7831054.1 hypothetical protein [Actinospica acidithermotolerans]